MPVPLLIHPDDPQPETWSDPRRGTYTYRQMLTSARIDSDTFTAGILDFRAGESWAVHRHPEAEIYLGLAGEADIEVDGALYRLTAQALLYIPGNVFHGVPSTAGPLRLFYAFAADRLETVAYTFRDDP